MKRKALRWFTLLGGGSAYLLLGGLGIIILVCIARMGGLLEGVELRTLDLFLRWRPSETTDERITILEITDADIQALGTYPVPDDELTRLLIELRTYNPRVIGLDIFRDIPVINPFQKDTEIARNSNRDLIKLLKDSPDIIVTDKILNSPVSAPPGVPQESVGFADALLDRDGFVRRSLLAAPSPVDQGYRFSLTIQLASRYLAAERLKLDNGIRDPIAMRFGTTELFRLSSDSGGYANQDTGGNPVTLINFRNGEQPFNKISLSEFMSGEVPEDWLTDRIVLIGMTAASTKDYLNSAAIASSNPGLVPGVEVQAHAVSQIISAVLDKRPILKTWSTPCEYFWIIVGGLLGTSLIHIQKSIPLSIGIFMTLGISLAIGGYSLIFAGLWIPVCPIWIAYCLNGSSTLLYRIYQHEQGWRIRLDERQRIIKQSYNTIHNGPLQTLKGLMRKVSSEAKGLSAQDLDAELKNINDELRSIHEFMQKEHLTLETRIYLTKNYVIDLRDPLHELLHQVYRNKLLESSSYFAKIKIKLPDFCPMNADFLSLEDKEDIIRFLEEALCNVEQHVISVTRLTVICKQEGDVNIVQVIDNGISIEEAATARENVKGRGTHQAESLAWRVGGHFSRRPNSPKGTICELIWPVHPPSIWMLWLRWLQTSAKYLTQKRT